jgi:aspartate aminotransferase
MVEEFGKRRDLIIAHFRKHLKNIEFVEPLGAFYFFFRVDNYFSPGIATAADWCAKLMATQGVAVVPGDAFGDPRWVRMSFAASEKDLVKALERITKFARSLPSR